MAKDTSKFKISYDGSALTTHEMDVKDLAPALLAIGELLEEANRVLNGDEIRIRVNIKAPQEGSIEVFFCVFQDFIHHTKSFLNGDGVNAVVNASELLAILGVGGTGVSKGVIGLLKWIKNRKIKSITKIEFDKYKIELEDGEVTVTTEKEIKLFSFLTIRKKFEAIIKKPLEKEGVDVVKFKGDDFEQKVTKEESDFFSSPSVAEEIIDEKEYQEHLQIVNISFQEDGKWKFFDGNNTFFADILDNDFLQKVKKNEKYFAHDDLLIVNLKRVQSIVSGSIRSNYTITKILGHRSAAVQIKLPFSNEKND